MREGAGTSSARWRLRSRLGTLANPKFRSNRLTEREFYGMYWIDAIRWFINRALMWKAAMTTRRLQAFVGTTDQAVPLWSAFQRYIYEEIGANISFIFGSLFAVAPTVQFPIANTPASILDSIENGLLNSQEGHLKQRQIGIILLKTNQNTQFWWCRTQDRTTANERYHWVFARKNPTNKRWAFYIWWQFEIWICVRTHQNWNRTFFKLGERWLMNYLQNSQARKISIFVGRRHLARFLHLTVNTWDNPLSWIFQAFCRWPWCQKCHHQCLHRKSTILEFSSSDPSLLRYEARVSIEIHSLSLVCRPCYLDMTPPQHGWT